MTTGGPRWIGEAFGIPVDSEFPIPGVAEARGRRSPDATGIELMAPRAHPWARTRDAGALLQEVRTARGRLTFAVREHPERGYELSAGRFGRYVVSHDGRLVECAPPTRRPWFWERFAVARALPLAAVLRGHDALHASAVSLDGRTIAFLGERGMGKTSIAVNLALLGASIVTDDVLALSLNGDVRAFPGAGVISVRREEDRLLSGWERQQVGTPLGRGAKVYREIGRQPTPTTLAAIYLLSRRVDGGRPAVVEVGPPDLRTLLGSFFVTFVATPSRLVRQLDLCAALVRSVRFFRLEMPAGSTSRTTAAVVASHTSSPSR
jgi:hypothetical protein